ncbi:glycosyltransferase family 2 protein [Enterococcus dongliensis]|uniref:glycosyltransferase family 2 protein n=1 Tax=Enterococcus dongliensis TaxID=2559925 RepID=UPI002891AB44|nr:glycosyltransferase [Enterococcus dongliensis]MDT2603110.1 glycosyltransferase [Enterococcus dongliensis]MDT2675551.1 glycosyltransferase [Enterococcus dongliensis]
MCKISVIVPVYNVEAYLENCLESISGQTETDIEIIVVDDGSPDKSGEIADNYRLRDNRVRVIHQDNGGLSAARNSGLDVAKGKYVCFIDSDDWIEPDYLELLLIGIEKYHSNISVLKINKIAEYSKIKELTSTKYGWEIIGKNEAMKVLFTNNKIGYSANNKLFEMNLFSNLRFPYGKLMEDKAVMYLLIDKSEQISINASEKYHYYQSPVSILRGRFNPKKFDTFDIQEDIIKFIDDKYPEISVKVRTRYVYTAIRMMMSMIENNYNKKADFKRCMSILIRYQNELEKDADFSKKIRLVAKGLVKFPNLPYKLSKSKIVAKLLSKVEMIK